VPSILGGSCGRALKEELELCNLEELGIQACTYPMGKHDEYHVRGNVQHKQCCSQGAKFLHHETGIYESCILVSSN
jgi:hypothetical protein